MKTKIEEMRESIKMVKNGLKKFDTYTLVKLINAYEILMTKFAPFKVGDKVRLTNTPKIEPLGEASGWWGSRHFLVQGATGIVRESSVYEGGIFYYDVVFDNESWKTNTGELVPIVENKHRYTFREDYLEKIEDKEEVI